MMDFNEKKLEKRNKREMCELCNLNIKLCNY